jgi:ribonuclease HI
MTHWQLPQAEFVKCNLDAAIFSTEKKVSVGDCIRDTREHFILEMFAYNNGVVTAAEAEAWALQQGIMWIAILEYQNVMFELDCKTVVEDVHSSKVNYSEYGLLIDDCKSLLSNHTNYLVVFTRRQTNGSAHALARAALSHASRITFHYIPNCIATFIMNEIS